MSLRSILGSLLFGLGICGLCTGSQNESCFKRETEKFSSVPGDMAVLRGNMEASDATWYDLKTDREVRNQTGRTLVLGENLWFLNLTLEDAGTYESILRTPMRCQRRQHRLVVEERVARECGMPRTVIDKLPYQGKDFLACGPHVYAKILEEYKITVSVKWYRGCDPIPDGTNKYEYGENRKLYITRVGNDDIGKYTCTITFRLGGIKGSISGTRELQLKDQYCLYPKVHQPANTMIKAKMGSHFNTTCRVFVESKGTCNVYLSWKVGKHTIGTNLSSHVYTTETHSRKQDVPIKGKWLEQYLIIPKLREEDFHVNYTCRALGRDSEEKYFTLLPTEPNITLPVGLVLGGVMVLSIISVIVHYLFKVDIVLWFRRSFSALYTNKDGDGKLYDAYVAYPPPGARGYSNEVETFAIQTLPQVMEKACGYKLFIAGRDCLPGQAIVDSVEENMQASRRLLLIYTASTFISKSSTSSRSGNNNNTTSTKKSETGEDSMSLDVSIEVNPDSRQQLECVAAMHRALMEGSLKVILVELEEIPPSQLALFPESVRHLRKKQGALCWWKNVRQRQRWRLCMRGRENKEKGGQYTKCRPPLSPSFSFWKEMRYHMPVRGKRAVHPEDTTLLNI